MSGASFRFTWYGHACLEIETARGTTILLDPWFRNPRSPRSPDDVDRCDVLLVTHGHFDHLGGDVAALPDSDAVRIAKRTHPVWPCMHEMDLWLGRVLAEGEAQVIGMNLGGTVEARGVRVSMVRADHSAGDWVEGAGAGLYLGASAGFVVELEDGGRVYLSGDTDVFGDMALIRDQHAPEVAFLPIGGHYTMGPEGAARAVELLGVRTVVPIHYGTFPVLAGTPDGLRSELASRGLDDVRVLSPDPGETVQIG